MRIIFYKLFCRKTGLVYAGKTKLTLQERLDSHIQNYNTFLDGRGDICGSFRIIEQEDYDIIDIKSLEFANIEDDRHIDIRIHEQLCITMLREDHGELCCNIKNAYTNMKEYQQEWYIENAERIKEHSKEYYNENADRINQKIVCDICGTEISKRHTPTHNKTDKHKQNKLKLKKLIENNIL